MQVSSRPKCGAILKATKSGTFQVLRKQTGRGCALQYWSVMRMSQRNLPCCSLFPATLYLILQLADFSPRKILLSARLFSAPSRAFPSAARFPSQSLRLPEISSFVRICFGLPVLCKLITRIQHTSNTSFHLQ